MRGVLVERLDAAECRYAEVRGTHSMTGLPTPLLPAWDAFDYGQRRSVLMDVVAGCASVRASGASTASIHAA
jgi:hypothetical protein